MIVAQLITWALAIGFALLTLRVYAALLGYKSLKEFYKQYDTDFSKSYFIILTCFMTLIYFVFFAGIYNSIRAPRDLPKNKYPDKRCASKLDSLKHENDSLRNELRIYIDGCDHKEQIYEQIIFDLTHQHSRKLNKQEIKDSL